MMIDDEEKLTKNTKEIVCEAVRQHYMYNVSDSTTVEMFEDVWTDISPGLETGIKKHLPAIREAIEQALASNSWTKKVQVMIQTSKL